MKRLKLERGKEELNWTGGNHLCGHFLRGIAREHLPANFQSRRKGVISDRDNCVSTLKVTYIQEAIGRASSSTAPIVE